MANIGTDTPDRGLRDVIRGVLDISKPTVGFAFHYSGFQEISLNATVTGRAKIVGSYNASLTSFSSFCTGLKMGRMKAFP